MRLQVVGQRACANLRTLAVPLGGCAKACVSFFLARCARGRCKWSETELALIYVRSLCRSLDMTIETFCTKIQVSIEE